MENNLFDAIVVGAGASGLMAAWELLQAGKKVLILEARERPGGRIHTVLENGFAEPLELGAEFIHGKLEHTLRILKKAGIPYHESTGDFWQERNGKLNKEQDFIEDYSLLEKKFKLLDHDIPVGQFLREYLSDEKASDLRFSLKNYVEGYYAGDLEKVSTFALREEMNTSQDVQYRVDGGYGAMIHYLLREIEGRGGECIYQAPVTAINWQPGKAEVFCGQRKWLASKVLVTVPIGVLQADQIQFSPGLPEKIGAVKALGYGPVVKTLLQFSDRFWADKKQTQGKDLSALSFIFSDAVIPTWWTQYPRKTGMITGWSGGPHARELDGLSADDIARKGIDSLAKIFGLDTKLLNGRLRASRVVNWLEESYSLGAYSYLVVNGSNLIKCVKQPVEGTVFFAGEGLIDTPEIGTVEAALASGREAAFAMIAAD